MTSRMVNERSKVFYMNILSTIFGGDPQFRSASLG